MRHAIVLLGCIVMLYGCADDGKVSSYDPSWDEEFRVGSEACGLRQYGKAAAYFQKAIETAETTDPNDLRIANVACYYAVMQAKRGKTKDAELLYRNALSIEEAKLAPNCSDVVQLRKDLANILRRNGKAAEARQVLARNARSKKNKNAGPPLVAKAAKRAWPAISKSDQQQADQLSAMNTGFAPDGVSQQLEYLRSPIHGGQQEVMKQR